MYELSNHGNDGRRYDDKSGGEMILEICRLLLLLIYSLAKWCLRWLWKGLRWLLKWIVRGLLALIDFTSEGIERLRAFWNDNDTQEKLRKMRVWCKVAARKSWRATKQAARWTMRKLVWLSIKAWEGSVWLAHATVRSIIHMGPTLKAMWQGLCKAAKTSWRWLKGVARAFRLWIARRRHAYRLFRKNKGFRGLLIDIGNWLKGLINNYIDEQPALDADAEEPEDSPFETEEELPDDEHVHTFGRSIYNAMKRIVED